MVYFSDIFNVDESIIEEYGAMNISLLNDIPLFIDPFLLYASEKQEYKLLHEKILDYLAFLRDKASGEISLEKLKDGIHFLKLNKIGLDIAKQAMEAWGWEKILGNQCQELFNVFFRI